MIAFSMFHSGFDMKPSASPSDSTAATAAPTHTIVYPSAVDWWLACLLAAPVVGCIGLGFALVGMGRPGDASTMFLVAAGITAITLVFAVPCRYTLLADTLSVRCGLIAYSIPYATIRSLSRSSTLASGPAMSIRRVVVETQSGRRHILSPKNREQFMIDVRARVPEIGLEPETDASSADASSTDPLPKPTD